MRKTKLQDYIETNFPLSYSVRYSKHLLKYSQVCIHDGNKIIERIRSISINSSFDDLDQAMIGKLEYDRTGKLPEGYELQQSLLNDDFEDTWNKNKKPLK